MNRILLFFACLFLASATYAQVGINAEFRPRTEYAHGLKTLAAPDQDPGFFTTQRTRLGLTFQDTKINAKFVLQDVRTFGNTPQLVVADGQSWVHEAWAEVQLYDKLFIKAGRQELVYDNSRIFGNVGWAQQARSHDLFLLKWMGPVRIDAGFAFNQAKPNLMSTFYPLAGNYKAMQFLWLNGKRGALTYSFLYMHNGLQYAEYDSLGAVTLDETVYSNTIGTNLKYKINKFKINGSFYLQNGMDGSKTDLNAFYAGLGVDWKISDKFDVTLGGEYLSGSSQTDTALMENNSFTPFYGTNHKFNGFMDYFYVGNHGNSVGLIDLHVKAKYKLCERADIGIHIHNFSAAADVADPLDPLKALDPGLGMEIDLVSGIKINEFASVKIGYSQMFGTSTLEALRGGSADETNNWAWVMFVFKPSYFININKDKTIK